MFNMIFLIFDILKVALLFKKCYLLLSSFMERM